MRAATNLFSVFADRQPDGRRRTDPHLVLLALNLLLVPLGYYASNKLGALGLVKVARTLVMALSLGGLLIYRPSARFYTRAARHGVFVAFVLANAAVLPLSVVAATSIDRFLTTLPFWVYINLIAAYIQSRYGPEDGLDRITRLLLMTYLFPVLIFFTAGNPFATLSIYGDESRGFVSNQFGWTSAMAVACLIDLRRRMARPGWLAQAAWGGALLGSLWLLLISGSRSGYLSAGVVLLLVLVLSKGLALGPRLALAVALVALPLYMVSDQGSALSLRLQKTETQLETEEPRIRTARRVFHTLETHEEYYLTGLGFGLLGDGVKALTGTHPGRLHNSYLELFVDTGAIVFSIFLFFLLFPALRRYLRYDARHHVALVPVFIIPYFENNLGPGQFLFYPWMLVLLWYLHDPRRGGRQALQGKAAPLGVPVPRLQAMDR